MGNSNKKQPNQSSRITEQDKAILVSEHFLYFQVLAKHLIEISRLIFKATQANAR